MLSLILYIAAAIFFALDAFRVPAPVAWTPLAFCFIIIATFII